MFCESYLGLPPSQGACWVVTASEPAPLSTPSLDSSHFCVPCGWRRVWNPPWASREPVKGSLVYLFGELCGLRVLVVLALVLVV